MNANLTTSTRFLTVVNTKEDERQAALMIESLKSFGGGLGDCSIWVSHPSGGSKDAFLKFKNVISLPLEMEEPFRHYELADKVFACARAEELCGPEVRSLVWLNLDCLIVNPPILFALDDHFDAALRPVHIQNVGSAASEPVDEYWQTVYKAAGVNEIPFSVESFVDGQIIRPYFNTHCFSINPSLGILQSWQNVFAQLVTDPGFQAGPCRDMLHQVFLHQVVLSALIMKTIQPERILNLPPGYSYPLHLQEKLPASRQISKISQAVCVVYEEMDKLDMIEVDEPLKTWMETYPA